MHVYRRPLVSEDDLENSIPSVRGSCSLARHGYTTQSQRVKSLFFRIEKDLKESGCEKCEATMTDWCINSTLPAEVLEKIFKVLPRRDLKTAVSKTVSRVDVMEKP